MKPLGINTFAVPFSTWDSVTIGVSYSLSPDKLTATKTANGYNAVRVTKGKTSGKWYGEIKVHTAGGVSGGASGNVGACRAECSVNALPGRDVQPGVSLQQGGTGYSNVGFWVNSPDFGYNDDAWVGIAVDVDLNKVWFRVSPGGVWNNDGFHNPATGLGGQSLTGTTAFLLHAALSDSASTATINVGKTAFVGAVPSGFLPWG